MVIYVGDIGDIEDWSHVDKALVNFSYAIEHAIGIQVIGHLDLDILGRHFSSVPVDDMKRYVLGPMVHLEPIRDRGVGMWGCLNAN